MSRPRTVTDEQILSAVRTSVRDHGPAVSLERVAAGLGVSQPALLKRFGSRQNLILAALMPASAPPFLAAVERGPDERPLKQQLEDLLAQLASYLCDVIPCISALRESGIPREEIMARLDKAPALTAVNGTFTAWLERAVEAKLVSAQGIHLACVSAAMLGAISARIHATHILNRPYPAISDAEFVSQIAELYSRALAAPEGAQKSRTTKVTDERRPPRSRAAHR